MYQSTLPTPASPPGLSVSEDGYIRLLPATFREIRLMHLISGLEEDPAFASSAAGGQAASITGYTEWVSPGMPAITVGWDWQLGAAADARSCRRLGEPRSNVMLIDELNRDAGPLWTAQFVGAVIDGMAWSAEVLSAVRLRYS